MIHLQLPVSDRVRDIAYFLDMEEWAANCLPDGEYFFTWHVPPTVIYGRNQNPAVELDADYCQANGIAMYQRKSGGGCVYADHGNLMISYITPSTDVEPTFAKYLQMIADVLQSAGIDARPNDHNDILVDGRKVSGNAYYRMPNRSIVHGTLLFDPDMQHMTRAITPSRSKLESNKVASVAARIVSIKQLTDRFASIDDLDRYLILQLKGKGA